MFAAVPNLITRKCHTKVHILSQFVLQVPTTQCTLILNVVLFSRQVPTKSMVVGGGNTCQTGHNPVQPQPSIDARTTCLCAQARHIRRSNTIR
jgi:hypothetical protein